MNFFNLNLISKTILSTALVGALAAPALARTSMPRSQAGHVKVAKANPGLKSGPDSGSQIAPAQKGKKQQKKSPIFRGRKTVKHSSKMNRHLKSAKTKPVKRGHQAGAGKGRRPKVNPQA